MNALALVGILLVLYGVAVVVITVKKPESIWKMKKIQLFIKVLGERGTVVFFYIFALICLVGGFVLMIRP